MKEMLSKPLPLGPSPPLSFPMVLILTSMIIVLPGLAQIRLSSDLDCSFSQPQNCRWRNETVQLESVGWVVAKASDDNVLDRFPVSEGNFDNSFVHTTSFARGWFEASLVSDVIPCQLGGARLKFWYYFTGKSSTLDVCIRLPPGSLDPAKLHCYPPLANYHRSQQWTYGSVELPPASQSMELILRARFQAPNDLVAVDDILYEASLCEAVHRGTSEGAGGKIDYGTAVDRTTLLSTSSEQIKPLIRSIPISNHNRNDPIIVPVAGSAETKIADSTASLKLDSSVVPLGNHLVSTLSPFPLLPHRFPIIASPKGLDDQGTRDIELQSSSGVTTDENGIRRKQLHLPPPPSSFQPPATIVNFEGNIAAGAKEGGLDGAYPTLDVSNCGLDCDFDSKHFCNYDASYDISTQPNARPWILSNRPVSNILTGIPHDSSTFLRRGNAATLAEAGSFAYAGNSGDVNHVYTLGLKDAVANGGPRVDKFRNAYSLHFDYYLAGVRGRLRVCLLSLTDIRMGSDGRHGGKESWSCPFEEDGADMSRDSREWRTGVVAISPGTRQIKFIADFLPKNYIVGLDAIRLLDEDGHLPARDCTSVTL